MISCNRERGLFMLSKRNKNILSHKKGGEYEACKYKESGWSYIVNHD